MVKFQRTLKYPGELDLTSTKNTSPSLYMSAILPCLILVHYDHEHSSYLHKCIVHLIG